MKRTIRYYLGLGMVWLLQRPLAWIMEYDEAISRAAMEAFGDDEDEYEPMLKEQAA